MKLPELLYLSSPANPRVRQAVRLRESSRCRRRDQLTIIDGLREVLRAAQAGFVPHQLFVTSKALEHPDVLNLLQSPRWLEAAIHLADPVFERIAFGERHEGIVAVVQAPEPTLENLKWHGVGPIVVLDRVEKPGNVGAVLRSADGAGASAVILSDAGTDCFNPIAIRASIGTIFSVPLAVASGNDVYQWLRSHDIPIYAARPEVSSSCWSRDLRGPVAFVFGNEAIGLADPWTGPEVSSVSLPMCGLADSLNVSVTAAVMLYEALRQRTAS